MSSKTFDVSLLSFYELPNFTLLFHRFFSFNANFFTCSFVKYTLDFLQNYHPRVQTISMLPLITWDHVRTMAEIVHHDKAWYCIMDHHMSCQNNYFKLSATVENYKNIYNVSDPSTESEHERCETLRERYYKKKI